MVPWMSKEDQCSGHIQRLPEMEHLIEWLYSLVQSSWGGIQYTSESCLLPCSLLSAHATYQASGTHSILQYNYISLHFDERVAVEQILLFYNSENLLVEIGSCLGLWLGLSAVGVFDLLVIAVFKIKEWFNKHKLHQNQDQVINQSVTTFEHRKLGSGVRAALKKNKSRSLSKSHLSI